ncbi:hypothetical protein [Streptosporangium sp. NPDC051022]|uniref:hypothetical protein n=1 Tax=Streptosporangium sp. NPDC051022 TaxID=3155752 RepID=UPI00342FB2CA
MPRLPDPRRPVGRPHRPLMVMVTLMLVLAVVSAAGLALDHRVLLGAPVWMKPLKFAVSFAVYGLTLAWMLSLPHRGHRWTSRIATVFAVTSVIDVGIIALQAARGTLSHFNLADDPREQFIQAVFALGVPGIMLANLLLALILAFQRIGDRATGRAIRTGIWLAVTGMALGYLMPLQHKTQVAHTVDGRPVPMMGGHSVGVPDGGPGLPVVGWSTTGGDLRIAHFVGLHGLQVTLILALVLTVLAARVPVLRDERTRAALVGVAAAGHAGLLALLTWQALRGQPLLRPDGLTLAALVLLVAATAWGVRTVVAAGRRRAAGPPAHGGPTPGALSRPSRPMVLGRR